MKWKSHHLLQIFISALSRLVKYKVPRNSDHADILQVSDKSLYSSQIVESSLFALFQMYSHLQKSDNRKEAKLTLCEPLVAENHATRE